MAESITIVDFNGYQENTRLRRPGGNSGGKMNVVYNGENWFLKFPKSTVDFDNPDISYTTAPLSEYIGSHIYEMLGIDVQQTLLGIKDKHCVCACKYVTGTGEEIYPFTNIKNEYHPDLIDCDAGPSTKNKIDIHKVIKVMNKNSLFVAHPELKDRFWDMYVVDAFIRNIDRNNDNWGVIVDNNDNSFLRVCPVFDNGNAFWKNHSEEKFMEMLLPEHFETEVYRKSKSIFYTEKISDKKVLDNPLKYIESLKNEDCNAAVLRIVPQIDLSSIRSFIMNIPNEFNGVKIANDAQKEFYCKSMEYIFHKVLLKTFMRYQTQVLSNSIDVSDRINGAKQLAELHNKFIGNSDKCDLSKCMDV